jgi:beta-glucosidase
MSFPPDFVWGAATASYQVEGAVHEGGRSESIWDRFSATPGKVRNGETGAIACDFYNRYPQDVRLMRELGIDAFRFSIAWPRVLPDGRGRVNQAGLDFYDRLTDELLAADIQPCVTLYHWDLPQVLEDEGGWPERATAYALPELAAAVADRLGDRVTRWITLNEPWVAAWLGYGWGEHAPGRRSDADAVAAAHHLLLAHGLATDVLRERCRGAQVGVTLNLTHADPATDSDADRDAARLVDGHFNRWFLDPLFKGRYPDDMPYAAPVLDGDLEVIARPVDFLGVNYYSRSVSTAGESGGPPVQVHVPGSSYTDMGWEVYPDGFSQTLERVARDYAPPAIYVTENGAAYGDVRDHEGAVRDPEREAYLAEHIAAVGRAIDAGAPVKGYFVWSLLDNFEWAHGYSKRFGIVYVDYPTLERVPKGSFGWYRSFIAKQREQVWRESA